MAIHEYLPSKNTMISDNCPSINRMKRKNNLDFLKSIDANTYFPKK